jgi:hypothetical protein
MKRSKADVWTVKTKPWNSSVGKFYRLFNELINKTKINYVWRVREK